MVSMQTIVVPEQMPSVIYNYFHYYSGMNLIPISNKSRKNRLMEFFLVKLRSTKNRIYTAIRNEDFKDINYTPLRISILPFVEPKIQIQSNFTTEFTMHSSLPLFGESVPEMSRASEGYPP